MAKNDFLPFAFAPTARVLEQSAYEGMTALRQDGFDAGIAEPDQLNKVWRQSSAIASMVAEFVSTTLNADVLDDGDGAALLAQFEDALDEALVPKTSPTGAALLPSGETTDRPNPATFGMFRGNIETFAPEFFDGVEWKQLGWNVGAGFAPGTRLLFAQATAPDGWAQVTDDAANNRMLRVVNDNSGNAVGGTASPILNNVVPAHTHVFETGTVSANSSHLHSGQTAGANADHSHGIGDPGHAHSIGGGVAGGNWGLGPVAFSNNAGGTNGSGTGIGGTGGFSNNHAHDFGTSWTDTNHIHGGSTDNGSSRTNWEPRYLNLILCVKE